MEPAEHRSAVRVGRFLSRTEAEVARGLLETNGVPAVVLGDDAGGVHPVGFADGGVALGVHPDDAEEAALLLADVDAPLVRGVLRSEGRRSRAVALVAAGLVVLLVVLYLQVLTTL